MGQRPKGDVPELKKSQRGRGYVNVDGQKKDLGKWGTPELANAYADFCQQWAKAHQLNQPFQAPASPTVNELYLEFAHYADQRYRRDDGTSTSEAEAFDLSFRPFGDRYGKLKAAVIGQAELEAVRAELIAAKLSRRTINKRIGRIKRVFRWGVSRGKVDAVVLTRLESVRDLEAGYSGVADPPPKRPVPLADVRSTQAHLNRHICAMIDLQLATGARPGEVCALRGADLNQQGVVHLKDHDVKLTGGVWIWQPRWHKNKRRNKLLVYVLGPNAIALLTPWLRTDPEEFLFQPREARAEWEQSRIARAKTHRRVPRVPVPAAAQKRRPRDHYDSDTYGNAIERAAELAGVPHWQPHQLRRLVGTQTDQAEGIEASRKRLGHASIATTELYVERDLQEAARLAQRYG